MTLDHYIETYVAPQCGMYDKDIGKAINIYQHYKINTQNQLLAKGWNDFYEIRRRSEARARGMVNNYLWS